MEATFSELKSGKLFNSEGQGRNSFWTAPSGKSVFKTLRTILKLELCRVNFLGFFTLYPSLHSSLHVFRKYCFKGAPKLHFRWRIGVLRSIDLQQDCWKRQWANFLNKKPLFTQVLLIPAHSRMMSRLSAGGSCGAPRSVGLSALSRHDQAAFPWAPRTAAMPQHEEAEQDPPRECTCQFPPGWEMKLCYPGHVHTRGLECTSEMVQKYTGDRCMCWHSHQTGKTGGAAGYIWLGIHIIHRI